MTDKELKDWLTGFALCAYITPHPIPQREPVAFLYGTCPEPLPKLPATDLPYMLIEYADVPMIVEGGKMARLICSSEPIICDKLGLSVGYSLLGDVLYFGWANHEAVWDLSLSMSAYEPQLNVWAKMSEEHFTERTFDAEQVIAADPVWANHYVAHPLVSSWTIDSSDPVPVYE